MNVAANLSRRFHHRLDRLDDLRGDLGRARVSRHAQRQRACVGFGVSGRRSGAGVVCEQSVSQVEGIVVNVILSRADGEGSPSRLRRGFLATLGMTFFPVIANACPVCFGGSDVSA